LLFFSLSKWKEGTHKCPLLLLLLLLTLLSSRRRRRGVVEVVAVGLGGLTALCRTRFVQHLKVL
jgi:MYXO-CTERM domain-containing protein